MFESDIKKALETQKDSYRKAKNVHNAFEQGGRGSQIDRKWSGSGLDCRCLNLSTSMGGTRSKVEDEDRHDLEPEGLRKDTRHEIYTGSGSRSSYPTSCLG
jgi:hypothetical protein